MVTEEHKRNGRDAGRDVGRGFGARCKAKPSTNGRYLDGRLAGPTPIKADSHRIGKVQTVRC